ncbi:hypothetical protein F0L74_09625 [Chitinophaga agrisoli]|uniref:Collagen triple helix repeat protein n=1 Tax=Chitinophaga agrisoli TaxID=2607653 RepID=A0A5B2VWZ0_9BACT|nr:hypothetical protein [Chitinophaga agrisoli]KAA2242777.1 hypothetical protein F0L74_09625 [Chitinophaga agrisoli]
MKRFNFTSPLVLLSGLFFVMFMISCGKDGAAGPQGPAGPAGPAGPKGDNTAGTVIYSDWLDVPFKPDTFHTAGGGIDTVGYFADVDVPKLTLALLNTADVKMYVNSKDASDPVIYPLPYTAGSGLYIEFNAYTQGISLYSNSDLSTFTRNGKKYQQFRYMIVPGNSEARSTAPVNWSDYAAVKAYLGLKN